MGDDLLPTLGDTSWFTEARFGMFIHWGLYSMAARHEWVQANERMDGAEYERRYFANFDPDRFDPEAWAAAAADAGMRYVVVTTKHHEGFCLWDSACTGFKATNTPARRDLLRPLVDAFRRRGLRIGLYYSLIDWHHPDFVIDPVIGPYRDHPRRAEMNRGRVQARYAAYMRDQVRELLTGYGDIDVLWFDYSYANDEGTGKGRADWESEKLHALVRELRPRILLNERLDLPGSWDVKTPEQFVPRSRVRCDGRPVVWEACQTFSGSWGYHRDEKTWRSTDELIRTLVDGVSKGGNLLLNVGPTARGDVDLRARERLVGIGAWMKLHARAIHGCTAAPDGFATPQDCRLTWNPRTRRLYVHCFAWPHKLLWLDGFAGKVAYAQLLHDGSEVDCRPLEPWQIRAWGEHVAGIGPESLALRLPVEKPPVEVPVIELVIREGG